MFPRAIILAGWLLVASPGLAQQGQITSNAATLTPAGNIAVAERVAALLEQRYVVPATGNRYAAKLRANASAGAYADFIEPAALAERITTDLQAVAPDGHLRVRMPRTRVGPAAGGGGGNAEIAPGVAEARWIQPGVAYLKFTRFSDDPVATTAVTGFLKTHQRARALIIDAREHRGGTFPLLAVFGDYLFARERRLVTMDIAAEAVRRDGVPFPTGIREIRQGTAPAGLVRYEHWTVPATDAPMLFRVPVYYLIAHRTFSAAEHLALVLKITGRATLTGEPTGGGNHFGGTEDVGSGLEVFVLIGRTSDPATGKDWEGVGVQPDVPVAAAGALDDALRRIAGAPATPATPPQPHKAGPPAADSRHR